jgi:CRISPR-associated protein Cas5d
VLRKIAFTNVKRNEVSQIASFNKPHLVTTEDRQQRFSMLLKDVRYIIEAHFELNPKANLTAEDTTDKYINMFNRRARQGQCYSQPYLGCREFSANFKLIEGDKPIPVGHYANSGEKDLGYMLYDIDYENDKQPIFFRANMINGVVDTRASEVLR